MERPRRLQQAGDGQARRWTRRGSRNSEAVQALAGATPSIPYGREGQRDSVDDKRLITRRMVGGRADPASVCAGGTVKQLHPLRSSVGDSSTAWYGGTSTALAQLDLPGGMRDTAVKALSQCWYRRWHDDDTVESHVFPASSCTTCRPQMQQFNGGLMYVPYEGRTQAHHCWP